MNLKEYIIEKSCEIGIDLIRFTDCEPLNRVKDFMLERKDKGYITEFEEECIEKRLNPKATFPDCKSIVVIGVSYNVDYDERPEFYLKGKLSMASWGQDYHRVLKEKIEKLICEIEKKTEFSYIYFVDTGPLIDRELARKAGVGFYGKNCSVINEKYGSFIFLGYILTDLSLEKDEVEEEKCGQCELCIKACPTGAIEGPYRINPKKCVSYLTQSKEDIPYDLRTKMGIKVYGCDTCQLVCPKNKGVRKNRGHEFIPNDTKGYLDIVELFQMSNKDFREKYGSMAGSWRGKKILKRNCLVALGNMKDERSLDFLKRVLVDKEPMMRKYAAWAILNINNNIGGNIIKDALKVETDKNVKEEMKKLLKNFHI